MALQRGTAAQAAFDDGCVFEQDGQLPAARIAFERAQRLAPADAEITMAVGRVRLALGEPRATEPFELVAHRDDARDAWLCLAAARLRFGYPELAAAELGQALHRHAPPETESFPAFATLVMQQTRRPGWCGLAADRVLRVGLATGQEITRLRVLADGRPLPLPPAVRAAHDVWHLQLPESILQVAQLEVMLDGVLDETALIGTPIQAARICRVEGFVAAAAGGLEGWLWLPGDPDRDPLVTLGTATARRPKTIRATIPAPLMLPHFWARPRRLTVPADALGGLRGLISVRGPDGRHLYGSPLDPGLERRSAAAATAATRLLFPAGRAPRSVAMAEAPSVPADIIGVPPRTPPDRRRKMAVVIPVYRGEEETMACLRAVLATVPRAVQVIVVEDASPEPELVAQLRELAQGGRIILHQRAENGGFPAAANDGMRLAVGRDVVLLNSDTLCPPGWLGRLRAAALSAPDIGTATPLSNDATIMSYPSVTAENPVPDLERMHQLDRLAAAVAKDVLVDLPTAIGFCMYIRRDCLDQVGLLRQDVFAQGYGEENDFCLRARHLGWRHVGVPGLFVAHVGGRSFGAAKTHLITRNLRLMERLHPGYDALVQEWISGDPMAPVRRRLDIQRWRDDGGNRESVILLTHGRDGGVKRHVAERVAALRAAGQRAVVLKPEGRAGALACQVQDGTTNDYPNLVFSLPAEFDALRALLAASRPVLMEVHHFIGHDPTLLRLPAELGIPHEVLLHDYAWVCARINLVGGERRYCGEPGLAFCESCVRDHGGLIEEKITPTALLARSSAFLGAARQVLAPSADVARRMRRHVPKLRPVITAWEDDSTLPPRLPPRARDAAAPVRVVVAGGIGIEKGYDFLLACARDAASRRMGLHFTVVGHTRDDGRLLDVGNVSVTGPYYSESEGLELIAAADADIGFLPSLWPETWCYALTLLWQAGLSVMAFDLGTPAERIRATGRGWLMPLNTPPAATTSALFTTGRQQRVGQIVPAG